MLLGLHASKNHVLLTYAPELEPTDQEFKKLFYNSCKWSRIKYRPRRISYQPRYNKLPLPSQEISTLKL
jgi:hypothetical protein